MPDFPAQRAAQVFSMPIPRGVIKPIPVITTRLFKRPPFQLAKLLPESCMKINEMFELYLMTAG
jgi:hypothetical protein